MAWYDVFSHFYDSSLTALYARHREEAAQALKLGPGMTVLDLPCGTGQSFGALQAGVGEEGRILGVDASGGMLARARERAQREGWENVRLVERRASALSRADLDDALGEGRGLDRVLCFLGLTTFDAWEASFDHVFDLLAPGGRMVIVDVYAERPGLQGHMVQLMARADLKRRVWEPLQARGEGFTRTAELADWRHGGELVIAAADKPLS